MSNTAQIVVYKQKEAIQQVDIQLDSPQTLVIGKKGFGANVPIDSKFVSRQHAQIWIQDNALFIRDADSRNGTFVNSRRIKQQITQLGHEDRITFGGEKGFFIQITLERKVIERDGNNFVVDKYTANLRINIPNVPPDVLLQQAHKLSALLAVQHEVVIGRSSTADIVLPELTVTRQHAKVRLEEDGSYTITDLGSRNGTYINGKRIEEGEIITLTDYDDINIGAYKFKLQQPAEDIRKHNAIIARGISKSVRGGRFTILRDLSFKIPVRRFVAIMGPSGCGKSTLLRALNGDFPATTGKVYIHDMELYENYDYLKRMIGYVPQDDIVHKELSVERSLFYAAKLRLSSDVSNADIGQKIDEVLTSLNINDPEIRARKIGKLSGGQRKRVSIAVELLTDPSILFLDEPTSPLDPETIEDFLLCLQQLSIEKGTTILMVTHKPSDLDYVDDLVFLSKGGYMTYYGPKKDYLRFFDAKNTIEVYSKNRTAELGSQWANKLRGLAKPSDEVQTANEEIEKHETESFWKQLFWLSVRYLNIKTNDRVNTLILLAQAPIIAGLIALIFNELELSVLFLMTISAIWFGTNNAVKEIVGELPIYRRERMFNLRIMPYILSKILVLSLFAAVQAFVFVGIVHKFVGTETLHMGAFWPNVGMMLYLSFSATLLGLLVSAWVSTTEKVMSIVPIVLIPQIMLAGVITSIPKESVIEGLSYSMYSRWGTEGFAYVQDSIRALSTLPQQPSDSLIYQTVDAVGFLNLPNTLGLHQELFTNLWAISLLNFLIFLILWWALRAKDNL